MNTKYITDFLDGIEWLFQIQNYEREVILKENDCTGEDKYTCADIILDEPY